MLRRPPMPAWIPALASSMHVALAVLRQHRSVPGVARIVLVTAGYAFAILPWISPTSQIVAAWLIVHALWFVGTDRFATAARRRGAAAGAPGAASGNSAASASLSRRGFVPVRVLAVIDETPDVRTFRLARPVGLTFAAGQFLPIRIRLDSGDHVRCYSISSSPEQAGYVEISVRRQGRVSGALHAAIAPGSVLNVRAPGGAFVYPPAASGPLVLLAGGIGVTPLRSMALHAVAADPDRSVVLIQSARDVPSLAFAEEFRLLQRRHASFRWVTAISGPGAGAEHYPGRIDEALLRLAVPDIARAVVCICGPAGMIDALRETASRLGVPHDRIRYERFEIAMAALGARAAEQDAVADDDGAPALVTFSRSSRQLSVPRRETLLDAAERHGIEIPSMCRAGICGTCRTRVLEGQVRCASELDTEDREGGYVLACVSHAVTDCAVDA